MRFLTRIWEVLGADRKLMVWSVLLGLLFTGLGIVPPLLVREMLHWLREPDAAGNFWLLGCGVAVVYLLRGAARYLYGLCSHIAAYRTLHRLSLRVYGHLQRMSPGYLNRHHSGNLVARTIGDVESVEDYLAHGIPESMLAIVIPATLSAVLLVINWQLALIALAPIPVIALMVYLITSSTRNAWRGARRRFAEVSATIQDHLSGLTVVQSFVRETDMARRVRLKSESYRDRMIYANKWSLVPAGVIEAASGAGFVLLIWAGGWMQPNGTSQPALAVDVADLVVLLMYLGQIVLPFLRLANLTENLQKASASAERVFELLDTPPDIVDPPSPVTPTDRSRAIQFDNVTFGYDGETTVLDEVSFEVRDGETVAIVGITGVGKSTACHLLLRLFDVTSGVVTIGGVDVRQLSLKWLREQIGMVSQDVFLFAGTIRENLLLGRLDAKEHEIVEACQLAHADDFIRKFPAGYDTLVGERGVRLSGGQKQRIAIARALLKNAPILVLDEATSAVDQETESRIKDALSQAMDGRTVLLVAHRHSTIRMADRILVLADGRLVETGTYEELLAADGPFCRVCRLSEDALI